MREAQLAGVQRLPVQSQPGLAAVGRVGHQWMPDRGEVDADLVRPPGVQGAQQRTDRTVAGAGRQRAEHTHVGPRVAPARTCADDRHTHPRARVAPHRGIDGERGLRRHAVGQRQVGAMDFARRDRARERGHGRQGARDHHHARGVLVQPVHDARARQQRGRPVPRQQRIEHRARPVARCRVDHEASRLVDDEQVRVLVQHVQRNRLRPERQALVRGHEFEADALAGLDPPGGHRGRAALDLHVASFDQMLKVTARELRRHGDQQTVQPHAMLGRRDDLLPQLGLRRLRRGVFRIRLRCRSRLRADVPLDGRPRCDRTGAAIIAVVCVGLHALIGGLASDRIRRCAADADAVGGTGHAACSRAQRGGFL